jgi:hypothetical protein
MKVLIACEYSGVVRDAFFARGHDAWSCDLLPSEKPGNHMMGDVTSLLDLGWDLIIAHPPCTYLCNSGVRWLHEREGRWDAMKAGARFFSQFLNCDCPRVAIENPIMHKHAKALIGVGQSQVIQPWQFGHPESKATCLWLKGLPLLTPTNIVEGREGKCHKTSPSVDRGKIRSRTYEGIGAAMAAQWSD